MKTNEILSAIKKRRSIRKYTKEPISAELISTILEAGRWAPSGLNNQPWKFMVIQDKKIQDNLALLTSSKHVIKTCNACIAVFYDITKGYNREKDILAIGACVQNMLLAAYSIGIGTVWLGEILNKKTQVNALFDIEDTYELFAVVALGYSKKKPTSKRRKLSSLLIK